MLGISFQSSWKKIPASNWLPQSAAHGVLLILDGSAAVGDDRVQWQSLRDSGFHNRVGLDVREVELAEEVAGRVAARPDIAQTRAELNELVPCVIDV